MIGLLNICRITIKMHCLIGRKNAPHAQLAVPRAEHFVPLFIAMGSGENSGEVIHRSYELGTLSYLCLRF